MDAVIHFNQGSVVVTTSGLAQTAACERVLDAILADARFERGMPMLFDHSELDVALLTSYEIRGIAEVFLSRSEALGSGRSAMVAPTDAAYGLARMFAVYADTEDRNVQAFRTREEAAEWLTS